MTWTVEFKSSRQAHEGANYAPHSPFFSVMMNVPISQAALTALSSRDGAGQKSSWPKVPNQRIQGTSNLEW